MPEASRFTFTSDAKVITPQQVVTLRLSPRPNANQFVRWHASAGILSSSQDMFVLPAEGDGMSIATPVPPVRGAGASRVENELQVKWDSAGVRPGQVEFSVQVYNLPQQGTGAGVGRPTRLRVGEVIDRATREREGRWPEPAYEGSMSVEVRELRDAQPYPIAVTDGPGIRTPLQVTLARTEERPTPDQALWEIIRATTLALSFDSYDQFIYRFFCLGEVDPEERDRFEELLRRRSLPFPDTDPYRLLKVGTELFMQLHCGVLLGEDGPRRDRLERMLNAEFLNEEQLRVYEAVLKGDIRDLWTQYVGRRPGMLPYLRAVRRNLLDTRLLPDRDTNTDPAYLELCEGILREKLTHPCFIELIWSYWHEEGMLVQTMKAIAIRFQNRRGPAERDPLAMVEIDPLRPLNNLIWGYIQDEHHRLTVPRRAYEYDHHYGITLMGKAVPAVRGADSRSRFLEAFHNLLYLCSIFYKEDDDTTVVADGFPVLNALREVHLLLSEGAHNQYRDLPWTARQEMLMEQLILSRPEFREFLPRRIMVDFPEQWMHSVEAMKTLQGWSDTSILHFRDLAVFGERILLSVRFGAWTSQIQPQFAANWARYFRAEVQGYIHAYRAVTGVDLTDQPDATQPSILLRQRLPGRTAGRLVPGQVRLPLTPRPAQRQLPARPAAQAQPARAMQPALAEWGVGEQ